MPLYSKLADGTLALRKGHRKVTGGLESQTLYGGSGGGATPPTPVGPTPAGTLFRRATMDGASLTGPDGFSSTNSNGGTFTLSTAQKRRGAYSARCTDEAQTANAAYARGLQDVAPLNLSEGSEFSYSSGFRLDAGYKASNKYTALMRLDNYYVKQPSGTDHLGIHLDTGAGQGIYMAREQTGGATPIRMGVLVPHAQIVEEQWFHIECFHKLHRTTGQAVNRAWVNGALVLDTTEANLLADFTSPWSMVRYGIAATSSAQLGSPRGMYIDDCAVGVGGILGVPA